MLLPTSRCLRNATEPMVANPSIGLRLRLKSRGISQNGYSLSASLPCVAVLRALRLHQWAKNLLIFVPLLLSHAVTKQKLLTALVAFGCFSVTASAAYIVNDLLDIEADRRHPRSACDLLPQAIFRHSLGFFSRPSCF